MDHSLNLSPALPDGTPLEDTDTIASHWRAPGSPFAPVVSVYLDAGAVRALTRTPPAVARAHDGPQTGGAPMAAAAAFRARFLFRSALASDSPVAWGFYSPPVFGWLYQGAGGGPARTFLSWPTPPTPDQWPDSGFLSDPRPLLDRVLSGRPPADGWIPAAAGSGARWLAPYQRGVQSLLAVLDAVAHYGRALGGPDLPVPAGGPPYPVGAPWPPPKGGA